MAIKIPIRRKIKPVLMAEAGKNNVITASRLGSMMRCLRAHFWQYEVGLRKDEVGVALKIGSAWARAMEARWRGDGYDAALSKALPEGQTEIDAQTAATIAGLLFSYYKTYGNSEHEGQLHPEVQFKGDLEFGFTVEGKMDGLGSLKNGHQVIIENKTTSASLEPDSDYWLRLAFNMQVYQYVLAARELNWNVDNVFYDVTRKPSIRPKNIDDLDAQGLKVVLNMDGTRAIKKDGSPRQSGGEGFIVQGHVETPDEYSERLIADIAERPGFYFARKEVPILDDQLEAFRLQRLAIAKLILSLRETETGLERREDAWPRNVGEFTCNFCSYKSFCLNNVSVDLNHPPEGFSVKPFNPELVDESVIESTQ
jgi:hypothetical protein